MLKARVCNAGETMKEEQSMMLGGVLKRSAYVVPSESAASRYRGGRTRASGRHLRKRACCFCIALIGVHFILGCGFFLSKHSLSNTKDAAQPRRHALSSMEYLSFAANHASQAELPARVNHKLHTPLEERLHAVLCRYQGDNCAAERRASGVPSMRVRVATVADAVTDSVCAAQASALATGIGVSLLGFAQPYSHMTRLHSYLAFAEREQLADADVLVMLDSDTLWTGDDLEATVAKFATHSSATAAALWPAAVRAWEDYGDRVGERFLRRRRTRNAAEVNASSLLQLPPILFGAEQLCSWRQRAPGQPHCYVSHATLDCLLDLVRNGHTTLTPDDITARLFIDRPSAEAALRAAHASAAACRLRGRCANASPSLRADDDADATFYNNLAGELNPARYLNAGVAMMRVWALRRYVAAFDTFVTTNQPTPILQNESHGWACDQSVHGHLYVRTRTWEAEHGLLDPAAQVVAGDTAEDQLGLYGALAGMVGLDRRSELVFTAAGILEEDKRNYVPTEYYSCHMASWHRRTWSWLTGLFRSRGCGGFRDRWRTSPTGCVLTPPLLRRSPFLEVVVREYRHGAQEATAAAVLFPLLHVPGQRKAAKYAEVLRFMPWRAAAHWSDAANRSLFRVLQTSDVEVWGPHERRYSIPFARLCLPFPFLFDAQG